MSDRWVDVMPESHVFELARIEPVVRAIIEIEARAVPLNRPRIATAIARAVDATYGTWAANWNWAVNNGGPVHHWCCASHSLLPDRERGRIEPTVRRICDAIADWRRFLEELDALFVTVRAPGDEPVEQLLERGATRILELVLQRTSAEDAWYGTFQTALGWFVETVVLEVSRAHDLIEEIVSGRFASWTTPTPEVAKLAIEDLALGIALREDGEPSDALAAWLAIRESAFASVPVIAARAPVSGDAHLRYIDERDRPRAADRADRLASALVLCRDSAAHGLDLTFDQLAEWQAVVMDAPAPVEFRAAEAFAKRGRERYSLDASTHAAFDSALDDANDLRVPLGVRAARIYLDVCFFHPFPDGNARAARLALDHVVSRAGLRLRAASPIFGLPRAAGDAQGAGSLAAAIERLVGPPG